MESKVAKYAQAALIEQARRMTPEQRLAAFFEHSRLMTELYLAGERMRAAVQSSRTNEQP